MKFGFDTMSYNDEPRPERERAVQVIERTPAQFMKKPETIDKELKSITAPKHKGMMVMGLISKWPNYDVWPFSYGLGVLGISSAATAGFLNKTFRDALYLDFRLRFSSYIGLMALSGVSSVIWHHIAVSNPIVQESSRYSCPICLQVRAAGVQLATGLVYPMIFAPVVSYVVASSFKDRHLPRIYNRPKDVLSYTTSVYKPLKGTLGVLAAAHVLISMGITYFQQKAFFNSVLPVLQGKDSLVKKPTHLLSD
ncbi:uncharacterized protein LOC110851723 isoform X2 [Folsomia candida]|uniref:uncharacterized protein LOC110851723 isoform X2 n=1 Tax=Folsomia candida TaxID=158441 RepID=UPI001604D03B|nr:uncharacterized protein LOC110851723 isoform X2 [Folsomia candida]